MCLTASLLAPAPRQPKKGKAMRQTALDSPNDRNQMHALYVMLTDTRAVPQAAEAKSKRKPGFAAWWRRLVARSRKRTARAKTLQNRQKVNNQTVSPRHLNPQSAASPLRPREAARWRAPEPKGDAAFFALLDGMGARHQVAARQDSLIAALERSIIERRHLR